MWDMAGGPRAPSVRAMALLLGFLGVLGFSFTLPATRVAVEELDPTFVGLGRAVVAGALAATLARRCRASRCPRAISAASSALVALGVVLGLPALAALALRDLPSAHAAVIVGILPAATAVAAVVRAGERPSRGFWLRAGRPGGRAGFAAAQGAGTPRAGDLLLLAAVALGALGYAEGAVLSREIGGGTTISWALVLSLPVTVRHRAHGGRGRRRPQRRAGRLARLRLRGAREHVPRLLRLVRGAGAGGVAKIGQVQLAQPVLTLVWSALLLGERRRRAHDARRDGRAGLRGAHSAQPRGRRGRYRGPEMRSGPAVSLGRVSDAAALQGMELVSQGKVRDIYAAARTGCCWWSRTGSRPTTWCIPRRSRTRARCSPA